MNKKNILVNRAFWILFVLSTSLIISGLAFGEETSGEGHATGIPRIVYYQALNFFGLIAILIYLTRSKVRLYFSQRHDKLASALIEAQRVQAEAEKKHQEYTVKIQNLENQANLIIDQIRKEGEEAKRRMIAEAQTLAQSIEQEAKKSAQNEIEKAKVELYDEVLQQALEGARAILKHSIAENDQKRLQREFVERIEAVQ